MLRLQQVRPQDVKWALRVLRCRQPSKASVQHAYREAMRKLHPDKVGHVDSFAQAVETVRRAKDICERAFSSQQAPGQPEKLRFQVQSRVPGQMKFEIRWNSPSIQENAAVQKYVVAAFDPKYGQALTIAVLEPDYSEELHRYVPIEELTMFVLSEQDFHKMPGLFQQPKVTIQVAAVNGAGQSPWAAVEIGLAATPPTATKPDVASGFGDHVVKRRRLTKSSSC